MTKTLKQDEEGSKSRDGMDIAFCKIDLKRRILEFSGAHRPLFIMKKGKLLEIKGDRYSIGGSQHKNQINFKFSSIQLEKGDGFFIFSDGFTDQFGGGEKPRKYGTKRLRTLLTENHDKNFKELEQIIANSWTTWRGNERQTDDVLLIGIEF